MTACGSAHLPHVAKGLQNRDALAGLWICDKNATGIAPDKFRRCWLYHLLMKPFYHLAGIEARERMHVTFFPVWQAWVRRQPLPVFDAVYSIMGHATELFAIAERTGALKVADASSSHPTSFFGFWQRECDLWNNGKGIVIPRWIFTRCNLDLERADVIVCPSKFVRDSMLYNGIPEAKCFLNPYGVDTSTFTPRADWPVKPRFISVGMISLRKGHQYLFRAFEKVRQVLPDAELICAGGYHPDFKQERKRWAGTFTHVQLSHAELAQVLRSATAFVFPSNEEGFARAIIEAMASGLPIIATHESGATTLVDDGVEGIIVKGRNIDQIAAAMIRVATNREENERMGKAAYTRGAQKNAWGDFADRLIQICERGFERRKLAGRSPEANKISGGSR